MPQAQIPQGTINYTEQGTGDPIVLVHGLLTNSGLWRDVVPELAKDFRVIAPDWPLGSHPEPMEEGTDFSPPGLAAIIAAFLEALDLRDVTLVANDTGGAISQLVAVNHPERLGRLVLTPCDAYENFLPPAFKPLQWMARVPGSIWLMAQSLRADLLRRTVAYGMLAKRRLEADMTRPWGEPIQRDRRIRAEVAAILRGIDSRYTLDAAKRYGEFDKPVLLAWAPEDRFFKLEFAERLARDFPNARIERIDDSSTFVMVDQPERTAELVATFAREPVGAAQG
jgi:pimeloyl-ACP methyl ester carboxylesterase